MQRLLVLAHFHLGIRILRLDLLEDVAFHIQKSSLIFSHSHIS
jgi:hypothetical protein